MHEFYSPHFRVKTVDNVTVIRLTDTEIRTPSQAEAVGRDLAALIEQIGRGRYLLDLAKTKYMSSTAFAMLFHFAKRVAAAQGQVRICHIDPDVRIGANILRLGDQIPICDDETTAIESF
ncbi:MAG: STAS domain-containing protein [Isosphaeraceae bacterium]|nr:STAS domain-containing protein [Isosphaeraceae bacterium]